MDSEVANAIDNGSGVPALHATWLRVVSMRIDANAMLPGTAHYSVVKSSSLSLLFSVSPFNYGNSHPAVFPPELFLVIRTQNLNFVV
jgi:hypothetical protein